MKLKFVIVVILLSALIFSCQRLPIEDTFGTAQFNLVDQNNSSQKFPELIKGKIAIVGYIFTNCPDICPLTTNNMRLIQDELKKEKINDEVEFVSISFDPEADRPEVLKKFAEIRDLDLNNWTLLTGEKAITDSLIKEAGVIAVIGDSTITKDGKTIYYYVHTDRISLVDEEGNIRKNYLGSKLKIDEVIKDIKKLQGNGILEIRFDFSFIIFGIVIGLLFLFSLIDILKNNFADQNKIVWILVVVFIPILGAILYFSIGRNQKIKKEN